MSDIFCKILAKELPAEIVAEGEHWVAIRNIRPAAPVHVLIIPRAHIATLTDIKPEDDVIMGSLLRATKIVAEKLGIANDGFRVIINHGQHGGQTIPHLHFHLMGGKKLESAMT